MPGSGKGLLKDILEKEFKVTVITMSEVLRKRYEKEKKENERLMDYAFRVRQMFGRGVVAKMCIEEIKGLNYDIIAFDGVRNWEEVEEFSKVGDVVIIAVHSPRALRYERLMKRGRADDPKDYESFVKRDFEELNMGIGTVISLADYVIVNDSTIDEFKVRAIEVLNKIIHGKDSRKSGS